MFNLQKQKVIVLSQIHRFLPSAVDSLNRPKVNFSPQRSCAGFCLLILHTADRVGTCYKTQQGTLLIIFDEVLLPSLACSKQKRFGTWAPKNQFGLQRAPKNQLVDATHTSSYTHTPKQPLWEAKTWFPPDGSFRRSQKKQIRGWDWRHLLKVGTTRPLPQKENKWFQGSC